MLLRSIDSKALLIELVVQEPDVDHWAHVILVGYTTTNKDRKPNTVDQSFPELANGQLVLHKRKRNMSYMVDQTCLASAIIKESHIVKVKLKIAHFRLFRILIASVEVWFSLTSVSDCWICCNPCWLATKAISPFVKWFFQLCPGLQKLAASGRHLLTDSS